MIKLLTWQELGLKPHVLVLIALAAVIGVYLLILSRREKREKDAATEQVRVLTADKLAAIPDDQLVDSVIRNLLAKLDEHRPDPYRDIPLLGEGRCAVYSVWVIEHEWRAGGFGALLRGTSAKFVPLAADGLRLLGATACAEQLDAAAALPPEQRKQADAAFGEALEREQPLTLCVAYIRDNSGQFIDN